MTWGIYARANHPTGWGWGTTSGVGGGSGGAHGYVLLIVEGDPPPAELRGVPFGMLASQDPSQKHGHDQWYGGDFDLVALSDSQPKIAWPYMNTFSDRYRSIGDNRAVLITSVDELKAYGATDIYGIRVNDGEPVSVGMRFP